MKRLGRLSQLPKLVAASVGYPTVRDGPFDWPGMAHLTPNQAAHVLAVAASTSLAYGQPTPREGIRKEAREALHDLGGDADFLSNGLWQAGNRSWNPLTSATFDCGLIGYDSNHAFIFWVEEED